MAHKSFNPAQPSLFSPGQLARTKGQSAADIRDTRVRTAERIQLRRNQEAIATFQEAHPQPRIEDVIRFIQNHPQGNGFNWSRLSTTQKVVLVITLGVVLTSQGLQLGQALGDCLAAFGEKLSEWRAAFSGPSAPRKDLGFGRETPSSTSTDLAYSQRYGKQQASRNTTKAESGSKSAHSKEQPKAAPSTGKLSVPFRSSNSSSSTGAHEAHSVADTHAVQHNETHSSGGGFREFVGKLGVVAYDFVTTDHLKFPVAAGAAIPESHPLEDEFHPLERRDVVSSKAPLKINATYVPSAFTAAGDGAVLLEGNLAHVIPLAANTDIRIQLANPGETVASLSSSVLSGSGVGVTAFRVNGTSWQAALYNIPANPGSPVVNGAATMVRLPSEGVNAVRVQAQPNGGFTSVYTAANGTFVQSFSSAGSPIGEPTQLSNSSSTNLDVYANEPGKLTVTWRQGTAAYASVVDVAAAGSITHTASNQIFPDTRVFRSAGRIVIAPDTGSATRLRLAPITAGGTPVLIEPPQAPDTVISIHSYTVTNNTAFVVYKNTDSNTGIDRFVFQQTKFEETGGLIRLGNTTSTLVKADAVTGVQLTRSPGGNQLLLTLESSGVGNSYGITIDPVTAGNGEVSVSVGDFPTSDFISRVPFNKDQAVFIYKCDDGNFCALPVDFEPPVPPAPPSPPGPGPVPGGSSSSSGAGLGPIIGALGAGVVVVIVGGVVYTRHSQKVANQYRVHEQEGDHPVTVMNVEGQSLSAAVARLSLERKPIDEDADGADIRLFLGQTTSVKFESDNYELSQIENTVTFETFSDDKVRTADDNLGTPRVYTLSHVSFKGAGSLNHEVKCKYLNGQWHLVTDGRKEGCSATRFRTVISFQTLTELKDHLVAHDYIDAPEGDEAPPSFSLVYRFDSTLTTDAVAAKKAAAKTALTLAMTDSINASVEQLSIHQDVDANTQINQTPQQIAKNADVILTVMQRLMALIQMPSLLSMQERVGILSSLMTQHSPLSQMLSQFSMDVISDQIPPVTARATVVTSHKFGIKPDVYTDHLDPAMKALLPGLGAAIFFFQTFASGTPVRKIELLDPASAVVTKASSRGSTEEQSEGLAKALVHLSTLVGRICESTIYGNISRIGHGLADSDAVAKWARNHAQHSRKAEHRDAYLLDSTTSFKDSFVTTISGKNQTEITVNARLAFYQRLSQFTDSIVAYVRTARSGLEMQHLKTTALDELTTAMSASNCKDDEVRDLLTHLHTTLNVCISGHGFDVGAFNGRLDTQILRLRKEQHSLRATYQSSIEGALEIIESDDEYLKHNPVFSESDQRSPSGLHYNPAVEPKYAKELKRYTDLQFKVTGDFFRYSANWVGDSRNLVLMEGPVAKGAVLKGTANDYQSIPRFVSDVVDALTDRDFLLPVGCPVEIEHDGKVTDKFSNYSGMFCINPREPVPERKFVFIDYRLSDADIQTQIDVQLPALGVRTRCDYRALLTEKLNTELKRSFELAAKDFKAAGRPLSGITVTGAKGSHGNISVYRVSMRMGDKDVRLMQCPTIPDHTALNPDDEGFIQMVVDLYRELQRDSSIYRSQPAYTRVFAHCSAGIGRSGMFVLALLGMLKAPEYLGNGIDGVRSLIKTVREGRHSAIQHEDQFPAALKLALNALLQILQEDARASGTSAGARRRTEDEPGIYEVSGSTDVVKFAWEPQDSSPEASLAGPRPPQQAVPRPPQLAAAAAAAASTKAQVAPDLQPGDRRLTARRVEAFPLTDLSDPLAGTSGTLRPAIATTSFSGGASYLELGEESDDDEPSGLGTGTVLNLMHQPAIPDPTTDDCIPASLIAYQASFKSAFAQALAEIKTQYQSGAKLADKDVVSILHAKWNDTHTGVESDDRTALWHAQRKKLQGYVAQLQASSDGDFSSFGLPGTVADELREDES